MTNVTIGNDTAHVFSLTSSSSKEKLVFLLLFALLFVTLQTRKRLNLQIR